MHLISVTVLYSVTAEFSALLDLFLLPHKIHTEDSVSPQTHPFSVARSGKMRLVGGYHPPALAREAPEMSPEERHEWVRPWYLTANSEKIKQLPLSLLCTLEQPGSVLLSPLTHLTSTKEFVNDRDHTALFVSQHAQRGQHQL